MKKLLDVTQLKNQLSSIVGIVNPIEWNSNGKIKKFSIYTTDEEDIIVESSLDFRQFRRLKSLLNKKVEATGRIYANDEGEKYIKLKRIRELTRPSAPAVNTFYPNKLEHALWPEEFAINFPQGWEAISENGNPIHFWEAS